MIIDGVHTWQYQNDKLNKSQSLLRVHFNTPPYSEKGQVLVNFEGCQESMMVIASRGFGEEISKVVSRGDMFNSDNIVL